MSLIACLQFLSLTLSCRCDVFVTVQQWATQQGITPSSSSILCSLILKLLQHLLRPFPAYWFHSSHIHSWFKTQEDHPQVPIFKRTIFVIHNEELGLCEPQQISFKVCSFLYSISSPSVLSPCFFSHYMHPIIISLRCPLLFLWCILSKMIMNYHQGWTKNTLFPQTFGHMIRW